MSGKIVLIGGGGHCKSILDTIRTIGLYDDIVITDNALAPGTVVMGATVVGDDTTLKELIKQGYRDALITIGGVGSMMLRRKMIAELKNLGFSFPTIIDPSAIISAEAKIGAGSFVGKRAVINAGATVGECSIINTGAIIEHNCKVGNNSHVAVGAILCGTVCLGDDSFVGAGSTVKDGVVIGDNVIIGAGSFVNKTIPNGVTAYGVPVKNTKGTSLG